MVELGGEEEDDEAQKGQKGAESLGLVGLAELHLLAEGSQGVVDQRVDDARHREHATNDGAHAGEEMRERLGPLRELDHDRRQVVHHEQT